MFSRVQSFFRQNFDLWMCTWVQRQQQGELQNVVFVRIHNENIFGVDIVQCVNDASSSRVRPRLRVAQFACEEFNDFLMRPNRKKAIVENTMPEIWNSRKILLLTLCHVRDLLGSHRTGADFCRHQFGLFYYELLPNRERSIHMVNDASAMRTSTDKDLLLLLALPRAPNYVNV